MALTHNTDNRDLTCTWLHGEPIEVNPWELVDNALENVGLPEGVGLKMFDIFESMIDFDETKRGIPSDRSVREILDEFCAVYNSSFREYIP